MALTSTDRRKLMLENDLHSLIMLENSQGLSSYENLLLQKLIKEYHEMNYESTK